MTDINEVRLSGRVITTQDRQYAAGNVDLLVALNVGGTTVNVALCDPQPRDRTLQPGDLVSCEGSVRSRWFRVAGQERQRTEIATNAIRREA